MEYSKDELIKWLRVEANEAFMEGGGDHMHNAVIRLIEDLSYNLIELRTAVTKISESYE